MKIEFEKGDVLRVAQRPQFQGTVVLVGDKYLTIREDSTAGREQIVLKEDVFEFIGDERGNTALDLRMSRPHVDVGDQAGMVRFRGHYQMTGGAPDKDLYRYLRLEERDFKRASSYFSSLRSVDRDLMGYTLQSITVVPGP